MHREQLSQHTISSPHSSSAFDICMHDSRHHIGKPKGTTKVGGRDGCTLYCPPQRHSYVKVSVDCSCNISSRSTSSLIFNVFERSVQVLECLHLNFWEEHDAYMTTYRSPCVSRTPCAFLGPRGLPTPTGVS
jgi:hypothetical protein